MATDSGSGERFRIAYLPTGVAVGFAIAVAAVVVVAFLSYSTLQTTADARARVTRAVEAIDHLQTLLSALQDAETGQRGFILTGDERYLEPYTTSRASLPGTMGTLRDLLNDEPAQKERLDTLGEMMTLKLAELQQTITLRQNGAVEQATDSIRSDRGKMLMDQARALIAAATSSERAAMAASQIQRDVAANQSMRATLFGSATLLVLIAAAALMTSRNFRQREGEAWIRSRHAGLAERIQGELRLDALGEHVLSYLAEHLDAAIGSVYLVEADHRLRRVGGYALAAEDLMSPVRQGDGLLGQAIKERRLLHVVDVPEAHLPVTSSVGRSAPRELVLAPAVVDGAAQAVVELGFFHHVSSHERELLQRASELLGIAVRSARDRSRLEELLEETQRQAEELQAQQEELRVNNEELEEQGHVLRESQTRLETQQAELEQTNTHLEEQAEELRLQTEQLEHAQTILAVKAADLERANQYKSEFLANMSHELRTPLNSTLILAKLLADNKDGTLTPEQVRYAQTISSAGNDLLTLINDVLDLAKVEAGKVEVVVEPVRVGPLLESLVRTFEPEARSKGLTLGVTLEPGVADRIHTDAQRLGQILKNLLSNALKFTPAGEVAVRARPDGDGVAFEVRDTGIGIEAHQQDVIFEAFRQADGSTHRKYGGTGLGLSIARDLARLLGGDLTVASRPNVGSLFTLTLPRTHTPTPQPVAARPSAPAAGTLPAKTPPVPSARPTVAPTSRHVDDDREQLSNSRVLLIVEDDERFAEVLRDLAHEHGFKCLIAHTASDGLQLADTHQPHAILLDVHLPDRSGLGVLDQLKRNPKTRHIPVHMASVADLQHEALELGAVGYAVKPVKRDELVQALERLDAKSSPGVRRVLVVEDDRRQLESISELLAAPTVQVVGADTAAGALQQLQATTFDCMVMDLNLPDLSGYDLLEKMAEQEGVSFPPVIIYTGRALSGEEEQRLGRYSRSIIIKDARSPERLLDEVTLFLHQVEASMTPERQRMLRVARDRDAAMDGRRILIVEDDIRNVYALTSLLEGKGARVVVARNGREAIDALARSRANESSAIDLVLMDIMMPEMDGFTAMREIRALPHWKKLPIIALTAKAMRDDQEQCLASGANDYIAKPLDVEKLLSLIRVWMPRPRD